MITKRIHFSKLGLVVATGLLLAHCHSLRTKTIIDAPPEKVWREFRQFQTYPDWNPFILKLEAEKGGRLAAGEQFMVRIQQPGKEPMDFEPIILVSNDSEFRWRGRFLMPGIFTGEHWFRVEVVEQDGRRKTLFTQGEEFSGLLVPFFPFDQTKKGFEMMNQALKKRVELGEKSPGK